MLYAIVGEDRADSLAARLAELPDFFRHLLAGQLSPTAQLGIACLLYCERRLRVIIPAPRQPRRDTP